MLETVSFPVYGQSLDEYGSASELLESVKSLGCDGIEAVWGDDAMGEPEGLTALGYHLLFYPDWVDFWKGDRDALLRKFGSEEAYTSFYRAKGQEDVVAWYKNDLDRAKRFGAKYVVFHVSDVSLEEGFTYKWEHTNKEVIDAAHQLINALMEGSDYTFHFLVENQWWPGFTFMDPDETAYLMEGINYENKGIVLDIGHLMNTDISIRTESEGAAHIHRQLENHGALCKYIKAVHLHQSLSGEYVAGNTGFLPEGLSEDYLTRFSQSYGHILNIDTHKPWTDGAIAGVIERINPLFLTHELSCKNRQEREQVVAIQKQTLHKGALYG